ncbi:MAG TPA: hypothetical protein VHX37_11630 [Acidobacteriaceae bacterium]|jgi:hypothetical protein|nr:hypothetical protein [Acidobacteriaceae bacterium]
MRKPLAFLAMAVLAVTAGAQVNAGDSADSGAQAGRIAASANQTTNVQAELTKKVDTKDAKVGDEVVARTTGKATLSDGTKLPKGSRLLGHVTEVQPKSREHHDAQLAFAFDHAVLRDGREVPVHAVMRSLAAPAAMNSSAEGDSMMDAGASMPPIGGGAVRGGGGLVGGAAGSLRGGAGAAGGLAGNTASSLDSGANGTLNTAGHAGADANALDRAGSFDSGLSGSASGAALPVGNLAGVTFATVDGSADAGRGGVTGSAGTSTMTMLTARGRNLSLASGSQMTLSLTPQ